MSETTDKATILSKEQAISMLPDGEEIHTFRQGGPCLFGADWSRKQILEAIDKYSFELSGKQATAMSHGMVFLDERGYVFVETKKAGE